MLFDTHVHLNDSRYENYHEIIEKARKENVRKMLVVGYDLESSKLAIKIASEYPFIYAAIGLHPDKANDEYENDLVELEKLINTKVVAIGEIGLDYHYEGYSKERQKDLFIKQIKIANKYNLPIVIHSRDACNDTLTVLKENKKYYEKGIMHCYAYSYESYIEFAKLGFVFAFGGVVTYKNARLSKEVAEKINLDKIVLETDAPYLAPSPHRGERNEPSYIRFVAEQIAQIKNIEIQDIENNNYKKNCDVLGMSY